MHRTTVSEILKIKALHPKFQPLPTIHANSEQNLPNIKVIIKGIIQHALADTCAVFSYIDAETATALSERKRVPTTTHTT